MDRIAYFTLIERQPEKGWMLVVAAGQPYEFEIGPFEAMQDARDFLDTNRAEISARVHNLDGPQ